VKVELLWSQVYIGGRWQGGATGLTNHGTSRVRRCEGRGSPTYRPRDRQVERIERQRGGSVSVVGAFGRAVFERSRSLGQSRSENRTSLPALCTPPLPCLKRHLKGHLQASQRSSAALFYERERCRLQGDLLARLRAPKQARQKGYRRLVVFAAQ